MYSVGFATFIFLVLSFIIGFVVAFIIKFSLVFIEFSSSLMDSSFYTKNKRRRSIKKIHRERLKKIFVNMEMKEKNDIINYYYHENDSKRVDDDKKH